MNFLKDFSQFIGEGADAHKRLFQLGLASRNQKFISDIEKIIELCPNLSYVTYPNKFSNFTSSSQVSMPHEEIEKAHNIINRLEDDGKMTPDLRKKIRSLGDTYKFKERLKLVEEIAKKEYGQEFLDEIDEYVNRKKQEGFDRMIDALKEIDADGTSDLYVSHVKGWDLPYTFFYGAKEGDRFDTGKILEILKGNPEAGDKVSHLEVSTTRPKDEESDFAKRMSSGEFGSLD